MPSSGMLVTVNVDSSLRSSSASKVGRRGAGVAVDRVH